jgi:[ribosomal protein S5]-alanine N-acetyltransferase
LLDDWPLVHEWGTHEPAYRYQVWGPNSEEDSKNFVAAAIASWSVPPEERSRFYWIAEHDVNGIVGAGELNLRDRRHRQGEISYIVHPNHWGNGHATQIARSLLAVAFDNRGCHRVFATCDPRNLASVAVLRNVGMHYEGRLRETMLLRDGWRDSDMFSILESEWRAPAGGPHSSS